ncbi:hypothetical protein [Tropheryma whipplei]|uniref:hypothetical protein n=1 Tax=Tropheryma whipplei TaxID=2039 RepID=UPI0004B240CD|nr:hypothetical protein [Tropheryma whipplei]
MTFSVFILAVTDLRGCSGSGGFGVLLDPQSLILSIYLLTGSFIFVTQPFIVVSPVLVELRNLR